MKRTHKFKAESGMKMKRGAQMLKNKAISEFFVNTTLSLLASISALLRLLVFLPIYHFITVSFLYAPGFSFKESTPTKIFTPNGDGFNDTYTLTFDNPAGNLLSQKKIYDITGAEIADFQVMGEETAQVINLVWNGKDKDGTTVRSGIYIYQVQSEGKVINGTIVVAR